VYVQPAPTQTVTQPAPTQNPGDTERDTWPVVSEYYADVNASNYPAAWALMSPQWQAAQISYQQWVNGYIGHNTGHVVKVGQDGNNVYVQVLGPQSCLAGSYIVDNGLITAGSLDGVCR
jgi:hypothetical protein